MRELTKKQKTLLSKWYKEQRLNDCGETNKFRKVMENNDNITKIMCKKCKLEKSVLIIPKFKKELINKFEREINKNE